MNYAIVKSMFGDYWVGKTELPVKDGSIFSTYDDAFEEAKAHASWIDVAEMESAKEHDEVETIEKGVEKFII